MRPFFTFALVFLVVSLFSQPSKGDIQRVLLEINKVRSKGCVCGQKWMPPAKPLSWDQDLYLVSKDYAKYMSKNRHFDHISKEGLDLGDRLDQKGIRWAKIGENLGYGYDDFFGVLKAWLESPSHCKMLMDPEMTHVGMSKYKMYWAQSFSKITSSLATASAQ